MYIPEKNSGVGLGFVIDAFQVPPAVQRQQLQQRHLLFPFPVKPGRELPSGESHSWPLASNQSRPIK